jgi:hypothetical protein
VVGGRSTATLLDERHPFWSATAAWGVDPGPARFASPGDRPGTATIFTHDGERILSLVELGPAPGASSGRLSPSAHWPGTHALSTRLAGSGEFNGIGCRVYRCC